VGWGLVEQNCVGGKRAVGYGGGAFWRVALPRRGTGSGGMDQGVWSVGGAGSQAAGGAWRRGWAGASGGWGRPGEGEWLVGGGGGGVGGGGGGGGRALFFVGGGGGGGGVKWEFTGARGGQWI